MKIFLGGIVGRYFEPDHVLAVQSLLLRHNAAIGAYRPRFHDALLDRARSRNAQEFLESDCDVHLSIDSDIVFQAKDAIAICEAAMTHDIVGGQYITRAKGRFCFPTTLVENGLRVYYGEDRTLVPAKYVSGGFVAVHRRVFEKLAEGLPMLHENTPSMRFRPWYQPFAVPGENESIYLSEDWALCERARQAGFGVWLDPSVRLQHIGTYAYRLEDLLTETLPTQPIWLTREAGGLYVREAIEDPSASRTTDPVRA